jgi:hypothetical protein
MGEPWRVSELPAEVLDQADRLVRAGYHLEAHRVLTLVLEDALEAQAVVAWLVRRKLNIHN